MLTSLQVRDFAIVDQISVEFEPGMTVLTGETGAGKSILVDAVALVLGERGSSQLVRSGAARAEFSAEFDISALPDVRAWLDEQALDQDGECLLRRVINVDGRSRAFVNGNTVTMQQLKSLGELLLDIHGQHFHQSLGRRPIQRDLLDFFGDLLEKRRATESAFEHWRSLQDRLETLLTANADRASRLDLLEFQLQELDALDVKQNEAAELLTERQKLSRHWSNSTIRLAPFSNCSKARASRSPKPATPCTATVSRSTWIQLAVIGSRNAWMRCSRSHANIELQRTNYWSFAANSA
jgi:DNA repair protein RecN (Recombination protein N)